MFSFQGTWFESHKRLNEVLSFKSASVNLFLMVEISGIEPLTSWMPFKRSPSWAIPPYIIERSPSPFYGLRTRFSAEKPRRLKQSTGLFLRAGFRVHFGIPWTLVSGPWNRFTHFQRFLSLVGQNGLEPSTSRLSVVCSSQLSYWPILPLLFKSAFLAAPSKLNNVKLLTLCTDLRTLQLKSSFQLKSP